MKDLILYLGEHSMLIMWTAISSSLLTSLYEWNRDRVKRKKSLAELIKQPPKAKHLSVAEFEQKRKDEKIVRLMRIHGVEEDKAIELQKVIDDEWNNTVVAAQKELDERNAKLLSKLH
jgi:hypothetical protein